MNPTNDTSAAFVFSAAGAVGYRCSLDGAAGEACDTGSKSYASLADGPHAFAVAAVDGAASEGPAASYAWIVDTSPPLAPSLDSTPPDPAGSGSALFTFSAADAVAYACSLDGAPAQACDGGSTSYDGLGDGPHAFSVTAADAAGNVGPAASYAWTVDTVPPGAPTFTAAPVDPTGATSAQFAFGASDAAGYACALDGAPATACDGGAASYTGLVEGRHQLTVVAFDQAGNASPPASHAWTVDRTPPQTTIGSGPSGVANERADAFTFTSSEPGSAFTCRLDGQAFASCTSPFAFAGLADGAHSFQVTAIDAAGNADPTPASRAWTVDTSLPQTTLLAGPSGTTGDVQAVFRFDSPLARATFECSLDGADYASCASPLTVGPLAAGPHAFFVRSVNVKLRDPSPAAAYWTIDPGAFTPPTQRDTTPPAKVRALKALSLDRGARSRGRARRTPISPGSRSPGGRVARRASSSRGRPRRSSTAASGTARRTRTSSSPSTPQATARRPRRRR
ncbi:MAG: hypothetical protein R3C15_08760 [Thermoleophilia bacterium]